MPPVLIFIKPGDISKEFQQNNFLWIENHKLNFSTKYCRALNLEYQFRIQGNSIFAGNTAVY